MTEAEMGLLMKVVNELMDKSENIMFLDEDGEILGGMTKVDNSFHPLKQCPESDEGFFQEGKKIHKLRSMTFAKVSSSPGHWVLCGRNKYCWVPG